MPLVRYFGWVGSFLLAALLAANWYLPAPADLKPGVLLNEKISIRIRTDHKWPERVVLNTAGTMANQPARLAAGEDAKSALKLRKPLGKS